jgi:CRP-like cAMP-binding protein
MSNPDDPLKGMLDSVKRQRDGNKDISFGRSKARKDTTGLNPLDLLALPNEQRELITYLSRRKQATVAEIHEALHLDTATVMSAIEALMKADYCREALVNGELAYSVVFGGKVSRSGRGVPQAIWDAVDLNNSVFLRQVSLFNHLTDDDLHRIADRTEARRYRRNEVILWQGNVDHNVYFVKNGIVGLTRLESGQKDTDFIGFVKQGEMLGEANLLTEYDVASNATATAMSDVELLVMPQADLLELLNNNREAALRLAKMVSRRLSNSRLQRPDTDETKVTLVFGTGLNSGQTTIGLALATALAETTHHPTVYTEHPKVDQLMELFGLRPDQIYVPHPAHFDVANIHTPPGLPSAVRTTLILDQLMTDYINIVISLPQTVDETTVYLMEYASQYVAVFNPTNESEDELTRLVDALKAHMNPAKTNLFVVCNQIEPDLDVTDYEKMVDFTVPYLGDVTTHESASLQELPEGLSYVAQILAERIGRTNELGVYVPSVDRDGNPVDVDLYVGETVKFLEKLFGTTATVTETQGTPTDDFDDPETVYLVRTYVRQSDLDRQLSDVLAFVEEMKYSLDQKIIALEVNHKMMLV